MSKIELTKKTGGDFGAEVEALSRNQEFMAFLEERSRETKRIPLAEVKKRLGLD